MFYDPLLRLHLIEVFLLFISTPLSAEEPSNFNWFAGGLFINQLTIHDSGCHDVTITEPHPPSPRSLHTAALLS